MERRFVGLELVGWIGLGLTQGGLTCLKLTRAYVFFSNDDEKYDF